MKYLPHIISTLVLIAACTGTPQEEEVQVPGASVTFLTSIEETKASVADDFSAFKWEAGDRITVLDGISAVEYSTKESGAQVLFTSDNGIADGVKHSPSLPMPTEALPESCSTCPLFREWMPRGWTYLPLLWLPVPTIPASRLPFFSEASAPTSNSPFRHQTT